MQTGYDYIPVVVAEVNIVSKSTINVYEHDCLCHSQININIT